MFDCRCPVCGLTETIEDNLNGKRVRCPRCDERFVAQRPNSIARTVVPQVTDDGKASTETGEITPEKLLNVAVDAGVEYMNFLTRIALIKAVLIFVALFFCCGLPTLLSVFQQPQK